MDITRKIKVLIVDDHPMVRRGLKILLDNFEDFDTVSDTADGRMAMALCDQFHPDVVLTDLLMPSMNGIELTSLILAKYPHIKIIVLTSSVDETLIRDVLKAGATSYVLKSGSVDEIAKTIRAAYQNIPTLAPEAVNALISSIYPSEEQMGANLTKREREVLAFIVDGLHNPEIGRRLFISTSTVKNHMNNIYSKLNTGSRTKVAALAIQYNLFIRI